MNRVLNVICNNELIEITPYLEDKYYIYNTYNNRTIIGNSAVVEYLKSHPKIDANSELFDFINNKKKKNILDFKFFDITLKSSKLSGISNFTRVTNNLWVVICSLILTAYYLINSFLLGNSNNNIFNWNKNIVGENPLFIIFIVICAEIIITFLHELSHFYYYQKFFKNKYVKIGISLRYFSLFLFSTSVPFINRMDKKKKLELIAAGIKTQITLSGLLSIILLSMSVPEYSTIVYMIYISNLFLIGINILPFLRLDGFWYISCLLNVENYMDTYKKMIFKKCASSRKILVIGTLNSLLIIFCIISAVYKIIIIFTS